MRWLFSPLLQDLTMNTIDRCAQRPVGFEHRLAAANWFMSNSMAQRARLLCPVLSLIVLTTLCAQLQGCGGGRDAAPDVQATAAPVSQPSGADAFLLFVNPQNQGATGSPAVNSLAYAQAYYQAIDPDRSRNSLGFRPGNCCRSPRTSPGRKPPATC